MVEHPGQQINVVCFGHEQGGVLGALVRLEQLDQFPGHALRRAGAFSGLLQQLFHGCCLRFFPEDRFRFGRSFGLAAKGSVIRDQLNLEVERLGAANVAL